MDQVKTYVVKFIQSIIEFGPKLVGALVVLFIGMYLINLTARLISKALTKREIDVSLQSFLSSLVSIGLKVLLLISVAGMLGIQTTSFVALVGALGLAIGLALQGSLANFAGGVLLLIFKPFKVGDLIESQGKTGHVLEIQIFNTILLTSENKTIILANGGVSNSTIVNYSRHGNLRVDITMAVAPDSNVEKVRTVTLQAIASNKFALKEPAPSVNVNNVGNGMITLAILPYADSKNYWNAFFTIQEDVKKAWDANNISGPTPTTITINK